MEDTQYFSDLERDLHSHPIIDNVRMIQKENRKKGMEQLREYEVSTEKNKIEKINFERLKETLFIDKIEHIGPKTIIITVTYTQNNV